MITQDNSGTAATKRHHIEVGRDGVIYEDRLKAEISMTRNIIRIGCTDIQLAAAHRILEMHAEKFSTDEDFQTVQ